jgi:preprotein translocase subunit SecG
MVSNAKVGGILSIISGAFSVFWLVCVLFMVLVMSNESLYPDITEMPAEFFRVWVI